MSTLIFNVPILINPIDNRARVLRSGETELGSLNAQIYRQQKIGGRFLKISRTVSVSYSDTQINGNEDVDDSPQELRVPIHWLEPSQALELAEWLRVTLHKWLDEEYCPEETNVEISKVAAKSFYNSMLEKRADLGDVLLKMALELESISYQESFHGAFSSANAAVNLLVQRISEEELLN